MTPAGALCGQGSFFIDSLFYIFHFLVPYVHNFVGTSEKNILVSHTGYTAVIPFVA